MAKVDAPPLTKSELEYFASLNHRELSRLYYGDDGSAMNEFAVRYRKACREYGHVIPPKFADQTQSQVEATQGDLELTPAQYHALPARELQIKLRDPRFKLAVMKLIRARAI